MLQFNMYDSVFASLEDSFRKYRIKNKSLEFVYSIGARIVNEATNRYYYVQF